jgi:hypothetical protein
VSSGSPVRASTSATPAARAPVLLMSETQGRLFRIRLAKDEGSELRARTPGGLFVGVGLRIEGVL